MTYRAILLTQGNGATRPELAVLDEAQTPDGEVLIRVDYSTLNYKDALAITGAAPVVRSWPMVPGIDLAGTIERGARGDWKDGDRVVVTGWGLGETTWGGLAEKSRVAAAWLLRPPASYGTRDCMAVGTAGFTAALSVLALRRHGLTPGDGEILVTGAAGGVGSMAVALLAALGYDVTASTGRLSEANYLKALGATRVIDRAELAAPGRPLQRERWMGAVDAVGGHTLANALAGAKSNGAVAACGLAQGTDLPTTVMPFILRGVSLLGINSVHVDNEKRRIAWDLLAENIGPDKLGLMTTEIGLSDAIGFAPEVLAGRARGRTVVDVRR